MRNDKKDSRIPKYFHSDGNGIHLEVGKKYLLISGNIKKEIFVIKEYRHFYFVRVNKKYNENISKYQEDFKFQIIENWQYISKLLTYILFAQKKGAKKLLKIARYNKQMLERALGIK